MKLIYCVAILLCPYLTSARVKKITPLSVGQAMVPILCDHVLNNPANSIDFSKYHGKLVILDFMLTTCSSCVKQLEEFDEYQIANSGKLQFIMVTKQKYEIAKTFLQKNPIAKKMSIPIISGDTKLRSLFPHQYETHMVWIGPDGIIKAITHGEYVTKNNIQWVLDGKPNHWPVKKDVMIFDYDKPLLKVSDQVRHIRDVKPLTAVILPYLPEVITNSLVRKDVKSRTVCRTMINVSIIDLYLWLAGKFRMDNSCILLNVNNRDRFVLDPSRFMKREWDENNTFCLQSFLPDSIPESVQVEKIYKDLDNYFNIRASLKPRVLPGLVLSRIRGSTLVPVIKKESMTIWSIIHQLNDLYSGRPVFNADNATDNIQIPITPAQVVQPEVLEKILHDAGYELIPENRKIDVLIIEEKPNPNF